MSRYGWLAAAVVVVLAVSAASEEEVGGATLNQCNMRNIPEFPGDRVKVTYPDLIKLRPLTLQVIPACVVVDVNGAQGQYIFDFAFCKNVGPCNSTNANHPIIQYESSGNQCHNGKNTQRCSGIGAPVSTAPSAKVDPNYYFTLLAGCNDYRAGLQLNIGGHPGHDGYTRSAQVTMRCDKSTVGTVPQVNFVGEEVTSVVAGRPRASLYKFSFPSHYSCPTFQCGKGTNPCGQGMCTESGCVCNQGAYINEQGTCGVSQRCPAGQYQRSANAGDCAPLYSKNTDYSSGVAAFAAMFVLFLLVDLGLGWLVYTKRKQVKYDDIS